MTHPIDRRTFIGGAAFAGAALGTTSCNPPRHDEPGRTDEAASASVTDFELSELSLSELQQGLESGRWTARSLCEKYLARIEEIDGQGPTLSSVLETNSEALAIADELDRERKEKGPRGPLHGIPVLLKDNIDTADSLQTTAGSLALLDSKPSQDAFITRRLREAGTVILGKANLSEWANFRSSNSSSGWSGRGGQCRNPYVLDRNPCGSSSGSGVAVSASLCTVAVGTETDGSIVCPSNANGIVGIKPTLGLVSRSGIIPIAHSQDTAGPMARTVADAATLLGALAGVDPRDPATQAASGHLAADYGAGLDARALKGARIGVARQFFGFNAAVDDVMSKALEVLKAQGAELIDPIEMATRGQFGDSEYEVLLYEFKADLGAYLAQRGGAMKSLKDLIDFNQANADREMPYFGQEIFIMAEEKGPLTDKAYKDALQKNHRLSRKEGIDAVMDKHRLDAIIAPTGGPAWTTDWVNGDHFGGGSSAFAAVSGYPNITVPAGFIHNLPVGLSFFGRAWSEPRLIGLAYSFEQASQIRQGPEFLPTLTM